MNTRIAARLSAAHKRWEREDRRLGWGSYRYNHKYKQPLFNGYELAIGLFAGLIVGLYIAV